MEFKSVESLIKTNNGFFKSDKQAEFLISQLSKNNIFVGSVYGNTFNITYVFDEKGIIKKEQYNIKTSKTEITWERKVAGVLTVQQEKKIKSLKRRISIEKRNLKLRLAEREDEYKSYKLQCAHFEDGGEYLIQKNEEAIEQGKKDIAYLENLINEIKMS